ncbi:MAG TPA: LuxR C-terminal-related transcriptional regulator, partial [Mycobacteriales bacterium]|nr:LuxR C-terminal-related transcriptional regulator [Mycobacteriales bacterium]
HEELLAVAVDLTGDEVDRALRELVEAAVLRPAADGQGLDFTHELVREAAYSELLPGERRRVHSRVADALRNVTAPGSTAPGLRGDPGTVAHHYLAAGRWADALPLLVQAGLSAERSYAFAEVRSRFEQADAVWDRVPDAGVVGRIGRWELLARAAQAADLLGEVADAVALAERALEALDAGDRAAQARLLERLGTYRFHTGDPATAEAAYTRALSLLPADPPSATRAGVLAGLAMLEMSRTRLPAATAAARESIAQAQAAGAPAQEGRARQALGVVVAWGGDLDGGVAELTSAARIAREIGDADDLAEATINLGHVLGVAGRYDEAAAVSLTGYEEARAAGLAREHGGHLLANAADALRKAGRWDTAEQVLAEARAGGARGLRAFAVLLQTSWLALRRGRHAAAKEHLAGAEALLASTGGAQVAWRRELLEVAVELAATTGRAGEAAALADEALDLTEAAQEPRSAGPLVAHALWACADDAERGRAGRDDAVARAAQERGEALHARALALVPCPVRDEDCLPETAALAAVCAGELGRLRERPDPAAWQRAVAAWSALSRPYEAAYAGWRAAEALFAVGRADDAAEALRTAHDRAAGLGAAALQEELAALAGWRRVPLQVLEPAPTAGAATGLGLTARELEVLARVTAGQTNREIAEALFISIKTASVHVSNILRKLAVGSREDAARVGRQVGLLPRPRSGEA